MLDAPDDLTADEVAHHVRSGWGIDIDDVTYAPLGHGSHNWIAVARDGSKWFIKSNRAHHEPEFFQATYRTAAAVHAQGLEFVHAAVPDRTGDLRPTVSAEWAIAVFPYIDGRNTDLQSRDRVQLARTLGQLHATAAIPEVAPRWTPGYLQPELHQLLANKLGHHWEGGPHGEDARAIILAGRRLVERLQDHHDQLLAQLEGSADPYVITHGEPHEGNTMVDSSGTIRLIDCDAMFVAPRERDLRLLLHGGHRVPTGWDNSEVIAAYQQAAGPVEPRPFVLELFRAEWHLIEISRYVSLFHGAHGDTSDTRARYAGLRSYLDIPRNWPELSPRS